ncbi:MAG: hypothetical protein K1060chlam1_00175 [Candidatus Anoxychlamydiales bacterium]|nr:hypothetical protein [Candidatus Anoxychlamydiales bacterium]
MSHLSLFFNTKIQDNSSNGLNLSNMGNSYLSPVRYFFHGREIRVFDKRIVHNKAYEGKWWGFYCNFFDSSKGFLKTLIMVYFFVPGLIIGTIAKSFTYLSKKTRIGHNLAKKHFTPIDVMAIGSEDNRLDEDGIIAELAKVKKDPLNRKVNNLVIYGNGNVQFNTDPGFVLMDPKKVVMVGARIIRDPCHSIRLDDKLSGKKRWLEKRFRGISNIKQVVASTFAAQLRVSSVKEALNHRTPRRSFLSSKRFHAVYLVYPK